MIRAVKKAVGIPVIASGDVFSQEAAAQIMEETGCDGVMIARGALGNPWIFRDLAAHPWEGRRGRGLRGPPGAPVRGCPTRRRGAARPWRNILPYRSTTMDPHRGDQFSQMLRLVHPGVEGRATSPRQGRTRNQRRRDEGPHRRDTNASIARFVSSGFSIITIWPASRITTSRDP